ncbi:uncharacterized protein LAESUDRAFT_569221 [Laetiporus sulphureus 93-53]|uniref:DUF6534 domain-containing protein n=1 Tax=Laetiporus sulphureus 93-53 TaxID=1314785 RepID=A0A165FI19_9APHY|nr:uncharacterized protein LAESUDRAFT_569221 [Laetiporus sulphureus 93-53]KZT09002.1 hypothetical protein LAESUDRAFT_569221 [Laetiporus sulphureus 93-53]
MFATDYVPCSIRYRCKMDQSLASEVKPTLGAILISLVFSAIFFGVTLLQMYQYYDRYWSDKLWLKTFVAVIGILDTLQLMTVVHSNWWYLVEHYADASALSIVPWSLATEVAITVSIGLFVQCFFASRVYRLSRNWAVTVPVVLLTVTQFILGIYYVVTGQKTKLASTIAGITWASTASLACSIAADTLITTSLCFYLQRSRSGLRRTDKLIDILIVYTVNTGLITTVLALCTIILSEVLANTYWDCITYFMISKSYVNSTLATLNARDKLRVAVLDTPTIRLIPLRPLEHARSMSDKEYVAQSHAEIQFIPNTPIIKSNFTEGFSV